MEQTLRDALTRGYERLVCWSDIIDAINVFPVRDADTGRNLRITLCPLRQSSGTEEEIRKRLLFGAAGNSGNIAAAFFSSFLPLASGEDLLKALRAGRDRAYRAVMDPKPGTMLTVFDQMVESFEKKQWVGRDFDLVLLLNDLKTAVKSTRGILPQLREAGVVDAGALAMLIYMEGFFKPPDKGSDDFLPIEDIFKGGLAPGGAGPGEDGGYCISSLVDLKDPAGADMESIRRAGHSVVINPEGSSAKIHIHTGDRSKMRERLSAMGEILQWNEERIADFPVSAPDQRGSVHIMTDGAGSVTSGDAGRLGMTVLDSYIVTDEGSFPETLCRADDIYRFMRGGMRVSTAQASLTERGYCYARAIGKYDRVLYLCTGSVYTGNFDAACSWKNGNDPGDRFMVMDTGAASGRLGLAAIATASHAMNTGDPDEVVRYARWAVENCQEYIFPDRLKYLVRGGRLSRAKGFLGDLVNMKPVISPLDDGAEKVGSVSGTDQQLSFVLKKLGHRFGERDRGTIMLEYSDNKSLVKGPLREKILERFPGLRIIIQPLSLTSGVHMGPATWGVASLPDETGRRV